MSFHQSFAIIHFDSFRLSLDRFDGTIDISVLLETGFPITLQIFQIARENDSWRDGKNYDDE